MASTLSIFIPAHDEEELSGPGSEAIKSPAVLRLEAYDSERSPWARSPEENRQREEEATERHRSWLKAKADKAKALNEHATNVVRRKLFFEEKSVEMARTKVNQSLANAERRRESFLHRRNRLSRERQDKENEVKIALARKSQARAERAQREAARCEAAARLRDERLRQISIRAKLPQVEATSEANSKQDATESITMLAGVSAVPCDAPVPTSPCVSQLCVQIEVHRRAADWEALREWIQEPATLALVDTWLLEVGARHEGGPRLVLALLAMHLHAPRLFDADAAHDKTMRREARRFGRRLFNALGLSLEERRTGAPPTEEAMVETVRRARRFHNAWSAIDKPACIDFFMNSLIVQRATENERRDDADRGPHQELHMQAAHQGPGAAADMPPAAETSRPMDLPSPNEPLPPEQVFAHIRSLGGANAEAEARRRSTGQWRCVQAASLEDHVRAIAHRAYWDAVGSAVGSGDYSSLWSALSELQKAMKVLVGPRIRDEIDDKFDVGWIESRVAHGALETADVHALMRFVSRLIASWQAPADDAETSVWLASTEAAMAAMGADAPLADFIHAHMVDFVRGATERVGKVYQHTVELVTERVLAAAEAQRAAQDTSDAAQQD